MFSRVIDVFGAFLMGALGIAALSLIVAPDSRFSDVVKNTGDMLSGIIKTSKNYPVAG